MSRAFVKENDLEPAGSDLPERPQSEHPNYVTPNGLAQLQQQAARLEGDRQQLVPHKDDPVVRQHLATVERDLRYLEGRLERAIMVDPDRQSTDSVLFGALVNLTDENGDRHEYAIVGEDEADISQHKVSWVSPLARALIGARLGDSVKWRRPAGDLELEITAIRYPAAKEKT
ncbi:transcription elongation factor GreA [mine drainage metagenome]|uniref:Transcription elongation factor GreA n=1 Tax=mine drainage metagenome TaxID=410659 RepID=A0A1J5Q9G2_9ZZZZ